MGVGGFDNPGRETWRPSRSIDVRAVVNAISICFGPAVSGVCCRVNFHLGRPSTITSGAGSKNQFGSRSWARCTLLRA